MGRNVTVMKQVTAEFCYDSTSLQYMKLQAADDALKTQLRYAVQRHVKSVICIVFEIIAQVGVLNRKFINNLLGVFPSCLSFMNFDF